MMSGASSGSPPNQVTFSRCAQDTFSIRAARPATSLIVFSLIRPALCDSKQYGQSKLQPIVGQMVRSTVLPKEHSILPSASSAALSSKLTIRPRSEKRFRIGWFSSSFPSSLKRYSSALLYAPHVPANRFTMAVLSLSGIGAARL